MANKKNTAKIGGDYEKYLTDMKELPEAQEEKTSPVQPKEIKREVEPPKNLEVKKTVQPENEKPPLKVEQAENQPKPEITTTYINQKYYSSSDVVLGVINLVAVILLFVALLKVPGKVMEYKKLSGELQKISESPAISELQIEQNKAKFDKLSSAFLSRTEIVNFVNDIELIKTSGSTIKSVNFTNEEIVQDKTGNYGYPLIIEMTGSWQDLSNDLEKIDKLQYLFRVVSFDSERNPEDNMVNLKYGGFLYVKSTGKN